MTALSKEARAYAESVKDDSIVARVALGGDAEWPEGYVETARRVMERAAAAHDEDDEPVEYENPYGTHGGHGGFDPREGYALGDPKRLGSGGRWGW